MLKFETAQLRVRIPKQVYNDMLREADLRCLPLSAFLCILAETYFADKRVRKLEAEAREAALKPKPRKLSQAELRRLEEEKRYNEEMAERAKEAKRGQEIMNDRLANPDRYKTQADKDWEKAQAKNDAYVPGSLLAELGEMLGDPDMKVDLPPEDYAKIYGKPKPNMVRGKPNDDDDADLDAVIAEMKRLGK